MSLVTSPHSNPKAALPVLPGHPSLRPQIAASAMAPHVLSHPHPFHRPVSSAARSQCSLNSTTPHPGQGPRRSPPDHPAAPRPCTGPRQLSPGYGASFLTRLPAAALARPESGLQWGPFTPIPPPTNTRGTTWCFYTHRTEGMEAVTPEGVKPRRAQHTAWEASRWRLSQRARS